MLRDAEPDPNAHPPERRALDWGRGFELLPSHCELAQLEQRSCQVVRECRAQVRRNGLRSRVCKLLPKCPHDRLAFGEGAELPTYFCELTETPKRVLSVVGLFPEPSGA